MKFKVLFLVLIFGQLSGYTQTVRPVGYPDRSSSMDVLPGFKTPPKGYGDVPFYWWQGDTLTRERIEWQLNQLQNKGISSLQINYSHQDHGGISYGLSNPSKPALFSDAWWDLFKWFAVEAHKRGMTVSLSDYTLGVGQGFAMDEALKAHPDMNGAVLRNSTKLLKGKGSWKLPAGFLNVTAYKINPDSSLRIETRKDLLPLVKEGTLNYEFGNETWKVTCVNEDRIIPSYDPMHPQSGKAYNHYFFDKFEKALPANSHMLDFFFSDELNFRVNGNLWDQYFRAEFKKRKGYDVVPFLDALYNNIGNITAKIRLDYNDVLVGLSEENFFKPVYEWHQSRGLIFGCDHGGRGRDLAEFGDYFRTQRWNQGPGSDQPGLAKDIVKAKVASSISHLYNRPRVWLEGFYGSGWGTTSSGITDAIFGNFVAGYNLLSFHGLYYSTQGGWWEWAPPCNHFRMPYWQQIDPLMQCVQRLAYTLSQGNHVCDVAVIYPTEPVVANMDGDKSVKVAFEAGTQLYDKGVDFDFIDFESIARAETKNGELKVSGEKYRVLVVPSMKVIRYSTLKKLEAFKKAGGIIVNIGELPETTEKNGANDTEVSKLITSIFSESKNVVKCNDQSEVYTAIAHLYTPDFKILSEVKDRPYVMHRAIGKREVYALYNLPEGTKCFFKSKGTVQLWNPWNGEIKSLSNYTKQTADGTEITLPLTNKEIQLIVFNPEASLPEAAIKEVTILKDPQRVAIDNIWEFELKPSLDNQWGDFQLPASKEMMGAQVRQLYFKENVDYDGEEFIIDKEQKKITCEYGLQFLKLGPLEKLPDEADLLKMIPRSKDDIVKIADKKYNWEDYSFSWRHGVEGDYGHQGYHGLKGQMYDNFIRLGALSEERHSLKRVPEKEGDFYMLYTTVLAPSDGSFELLSGDKKPLLLFVNGSKIDSNNKTVLLNKGRNALLVVYDKACETYLAFRMPGVPRPAPQQVSMHWYGDEGLLPFDCSPVTHARSGVYAFESAPGLRSFTFSAYGSVMTWINGNETEPVAVHQNRDGLTSYKVTINDPKMESSQVIMKIDYLSGYVGGAAIPQYINQECGKGNITLGDWSKIDGLRAYSGGAWYRKMIKIEASDLQHKLEIDLGEVVSSAELIVNGKSAGIKLSPPFKFDITTLAKAGENSIEVLVYNTASNNYTTIPTRYRGEIKSGLIGPVTILKAK
ncbi:MAG: hypothetical protein HXX14_15215 [Bacteroidetes bacterium]|nr:hypothetical protein [Bacteroidota bacterium]